MKRRIKKEEQAIGEKATKRDEKKDKKEKVRTRREGRAKK